jgi:hypothetical protein
MPVYGDLRTMSLCDLLQWASLTQKTGVLEIERNNVSRRIEFRKGWIGACSSDDPPARLGQFLLARGKIDKDALREALTTQEVTRKHLGLILMEMGLLSQQELQRQVSAKAEETIQSLFDWEDAVFRFYEGATLDPNQMEVSLSVSDILMRGVQHHDELRRIRETFDSSGIVLGRTERPMPEGLTSKPMAKRILESIDGMRTMGETLLHAHASEFLVIKFLYRLYQLGLVEILDTRPVSDSSTLLDTTTPTGFRSFSWGEDADLPRSGPVDPAEFRQRDSQVRADLAQSLRQLREGAEDPDLETEVEVARRLLSRGEYEAALEVLNASYRAEPTENYLRRLIAKAEAAYLETLRNEDLSSTMVPHRLTPAGDLPQGSLRTEELYLLSLVDGQADVKAILWLAPLREVDALKALRRLLDRGLIEVREPVGVVADRAAVV